MGSHLQKIQAELRICLQRGFPCSVGITRKNSEIKSRPIMSPPKQNTQITKLPNLNRTKYLAQALTYMNRTNLENASYDGYHKISIVPSSQDDNSVFMESATI